MPSDSESSSSLSSVGEYPLQGIPPSTPGGEGVWVRARAALGSWDGTLAFTFQISHGAHFLLIPVMFSFLNICFIFIF